MDGSIKTNEDLENTDDIPIELIQGGFKISDQEVTQQNCLHLEVSIIYLGT